jgi:hypothetical protein
MSSGKRRKAVLEAVADEVWMVIRPKKGRRS